MFSPAIYYYPHTNQWRRYGAILVPTWFTYVFSYTGNNKQLLGFLDAIELVMETGFAVTAMVAVILNLSLPYDIEEDVEAITETDAHDPAITGSSSREGDVENLPVVSPKDEK